MARVVQVMSGYMNYGGWLPDHTDGCSHNCSMADLAAKPSALLVMDCANVNRSFMVNGVQGLIDYSRVPGVIEGAAGVDLREAVICEYSSHNPEHIDYLGALKKSGYTVVERRLRAVTGSDGTHKLICNMDAEVANEALLRSHAHDVVVIGSGDADFVPLVHALRMQGKKVLVAANKPAISRQLAEAVGFNRVIEFGQYQKSLAMAPGERAPWPNHLKQVDRVPAQEIGSPGKTDSATLLIDGFNLYNSAGHEGWRINWRRLVSEAETKYGNLSNVLLFDRGPKPAVVNDLYARLQDEGWRVELKEPKSSGSYSCVVEMACASIEAARRGDSVVLATGSGHLLSTVRRLKENGVSVGLMAPECGLSGLLHKEFSPEAFYSITSHREELIYRNSGPSSASWIDRGLPPLPSPRLPSRPGQGQQSPQ